MPRVLIIAYHFPPCIGSSGLLRSEKFANYLPEFGWDPLVLVPHPRAYESVDAKAVATSHPNVIRAFALDSKKHLSIGEHYSNWTALPDRWITWLFGAVPAGLRAIRKHEIDLIFSTFPISTAILIGLILHRLTGLPWVVDLRDSMTEDDYPKDRRTRAVRRWIERQAVRRASFVLFTAASTRRMYLERYPELDPDKAIMVPNGYDEADFAGLNISSDPATTPGKALTLIHTGVIYPEERDPVPFFRALSRLKQEQRISAADLRIVLRAAGCEDHFQKVIDELSIGDIVQLLPHVPYREALQECANADGFLLLQAANCNHQIPAKAYEYLRLGKPIFALTSRAGDTAALLEQVGGSTIADLASEDDIYARLPAFLGSLRSGTHPLPRPADVRRFDRKNQAREVADCLTRASQEKCVSNPQAIEKAAG